MVTHVHACQHKFEGSFTNVEWASSLVQKVTNFERIRIDVGLAFNAPFTKHWANKYPQTLILSIEPSIHSLSVIFTVHPPPYKSNTLLQLHPTGFAYLSQNYPVLIDNILFLPCAVTNSEWKEIEFYETTDPGTSSLHQPTAHPLRMVSKVTATTLDSILESLKVPTEKLIEVIKIDTQGHDLMVLLGAENCLEKTLYVQIEISTYGQYHGAPEIFLAMDSFLRNRNFRMEHRDPRGDAIYINKKLSHLASLVSHDLLDDI